MATQRLKSQPHKELITDGTPFSSAHAYKAEGGGSFLWCGTAKSRRVQGTPLPRHKKAPHNIYLLIIDLIKWM